MREFDLLVIGSGPAGQKAAIQAAKLRKRVAVIEKEKVVGGACINTGTLPSKTLKDAIYYLHGFKQRSFERYDRQLRHQAMKQLRIDIAAGEHGHRNLTTDVDLAG